MRVLRGRVSDPEADDEVVVRMVERAANDRTPALRIWRPPRQCSFGRRDVRADGYPRAREAAIEHGFPPVERRAGGRAVALTGRTIAIARVDPVEDLRDGIAERYDDVVTAVQRALWRLGVPAQRGEPEGAFCPGGPSLQWNGKLAGFSQRVRQDVAFVGGVLIVGDSSQIGGVLDAVYGALDVPFDPDTVGSIERAGGRVDVRSTIRAIEAALLGDHVPDVEDVDQEG